MTLDITLSNGCVAKIDEEFSHLLAFKWHYSNGYARRQEWANRKFVRNVYLHQEILPDVTRIDHINGDRLDCRRDNLREASAAVNARNKAGMLGVRYRPKTGSWLARINGKHLGSFSTEQAARRARLMAEKTLWGIQPRRLQLFVDAGLEAC